MSHKAADTSPGQVNDDTLPRALKLEYPQTS